MAEQVRVSTPVTQQSHGFSRGTAVAFDGYNWVQAYTVPGVAPRGLVGAVLDNNAFEFVQMGAVEGLVDLTPGATYYPDVDGISTTVNGDPIGQAYSAEVLFVAPPSSTTAVSATDSSAAVAAAIAAEVVRANSTYSRLTHTHDTYLKNISAGAVVSIADDYPGLVFSKIDGTQVLEA